MGPQSFHEHPSHHLWLHAKARCYMINLRLRGTGDDPNGQGKTLLEAVMPFDANHYQSGFPEHVASLSQPINWLLAHGCKRS
jgi:hypothetical protein